MFLSFERERARTYMDTSGLRSCMGLLDLALNKIVQTRISTIICNIHCLYLQKRVVSVTKGKVHRLAPFAKKVETRYVCIVYSIYFSIHQIIVVYTILQ